MAGMRAIDLLGDHLTRWFTLALDRYSPTPYLDTRIYFSSVLGKHETF